MPLSLVPYLKRPTAGLSGYEWDAYYDYQIESDQSVKDSLETISKVAEAKGISLEDAMKLVQELETANASEGGTTALVLQHLDIVPVLEQVKLKQRKQQQKQHYAIAKIIVRSRLKPLFFNDYKDELAAYEIDVTADELKRLKEIKPHERLLSALQSDIVDRLFGMLPESVLSEVQSFVSDELSGGKDEVEEDKTTNPLSE